MEGPLTLGTSSSGADVKNAGLFHSFENPEEYQP